MTVDNSKLAFSSAFRYERIALKGHASFSIGSFGFQTYTIVHGLGYAPYVKLYYGFGDGKIYPMFAGAASYAIGGNQFQVDDISVGTQSITIQAENNDTPTINFTVYYRIYNEPQT